MEKATTGHDAKPRDGGLLERRDWEELERESRRVFALNEVEQGDIYYHMPSHLH